MAPMRVLVAPDKLRGTATAAEAAAAIGAGVRAAGATPDSCPLADGGEGFLDSLGGPNRTADVSDALGRPLTVGWRLADELAVIETAMLSTQVLLDGPGPAEAVAATSAGAGELIGEAIRAGAQRILVGLGGSAFSDGGTGALTALADLVPFRPSLEVLLGCDVETGYLDAARVFGPQKGADQQAVEQLSRRLARQAEQLADRFDRDVTGVPGTGAAGGLAGGLYAAGARLQSGFSIVAERVGLADRLASAELVITAEGRLDDSSWAGKVVGGLIKQSSRPVWVIAGAVQPELSIPETVQVLGLTATFGSERAHQDTQFCLTEAARRIVERIAPS
ncbi:MAG TPA: glycerate kinase [Jatrophihabitans sp.]|nr:glycerate kinase [Jatrophihabitans sp.]